MWVLEEDEHLSVSATTQQSIQFNLSRPDRVVESGYTSKVADNYRKPADMPSTQEVATSYERAIAPYCSSFSVAMLGQACCY